MTAPVALLNWRPRTTFYYGWLVIGMAGLATFAATGVSQVVMSGVQGFILEDLEWNRSTIAIAATAGTWTAGVITPFVGRLTDRYGPRWLMAIGVIIVGISYFSLAGSHSIWQFYLAFILGRAMSNPVLIGVVLRTAAVNFFQRKRNMVLAMTSMSRPVGGAINIQIISTIAVSFGWRTAYRYLGIMSFLLAVPLMVIMRRRPEDIGLLPDGARPEALPPRPPRGRGPSVSPGGPPQIGPTGEADPEFSWTAREALRTRAFWLVAVSAALGTLGASTIGFSMVLYLQDKAGISEANAARVLSISTLMALTNLGWGYLADRYGPPVVFHGDPGVRLGDNNLLVYRQFSSRSIRLRPAMGNIHELRGRHGEHGIGPVLRPGLLRVRHRGPGATADGSPGAGAQFRGAGSRGNWKLYRHKWHHGRSVLASRDTDCSRPSPSSAPPGLRHSFQVTTAPGLTAMDRPREFDPIWKIGRAI